MTWLTMAQVHEGIKVHFYRFFIRRSQKECDALIFISRSAQEDFCMLLGAPKGYAAVVHHGRNPAFQPLDAPEDLVAVCAKYALPAKYILYVGTIEPRKNLERLITAFALVAPSHPDVSLVIAGMMGWKQEHLLGVVEEQGLKDRVLFPGFIAEDDKALLIAGCSLFVYVSLYEGFGLPVLEALSCGVPTITSNISSLPEVAGDAACLIDPTNTSELVHAIETLLTDPQAANELRKKGPEQAKLFTWQRAAEQTLAVYKASMRSGQGKQRTKLL